MQYENKEKNGYTFLSLFAGAGGLDLGFDIAGFVHTESNEILQCAVDTLRINKPSWHIVHQDVREYIPSYKKGLDVLLAGFPCQGFSLGGNRDENDERNNLYKEVLRIAQIMNPRVILLENVLNLRTMKHPKTGLPFAKQITNELAQIGYQTKFDFFRVSEHGVPQTRRRFIFIATKEEGLVKFRFPKAGQNTSIYNFIYDLGQDMSIEIPNHNASWGFKSFAHKETGGEILSTDIAVPVRLSRTASDGNPIRRFDEPFPAIDTATVWGWAQGNVIAKRVSKDRKNSKFVRNPNSKVKLWRISASRIRPFTAREYARLQTFPDDWIFCGKNKRELQLQIGNAVPVEFARRLALRIEEMLKIKDGKKKFIIEHGEQIEIF